MECQPADAGHRHRQRNATHSNPARSKAIQTSQPAVLDAAATALVLTRRPSIKAKVSKQGWGGLSAEDRVAHSAFVCWCVSHGLVSDAAIEAIFEATGLQDEALERATELSVKAVARWMRELYQQASGAALEDWLWLARPIIEDHRGERTPGLLLWVDGARNYTINAMRLPHDIRQLVLDAIRLLCSKFSVASCSLTVSEGGDFFGEVMREAEHAWENGRLQQSLEEIDREYFELAEYLGGHDDPEAAWLHFREWFSDLMSHKQRDVSGAQLLEDIGRLPPAWQHTPMSELLTTIAQEVIEFERHESPFYIDLAGMDHFDNCEIEPLAGATFVGLDPNWDELMEEQYSMSFQTETYWTGFLALSPKSLTWAYRALRGLAIGSGLLERLDSLCHEVIP